MTKALAIVVGTAVVADAGFQRFWANYPRKHKRLDALKAFQKIAPAIELIDQMVIALEWQRRQPQWTKDGGAFCPLPASWLRGKQWEDEPFHAPQVSARTAKLMQATEEFLK